MLFNERLKNCFFEYDGKYSYDFNLDIISWNHTDSPTPIIEQERIPGAPRDTIFYTGTHENKIIDIECYLDIRQDKSRKNDLITNIKNWLSTFEYRKLKFSDDIGHYEGLCISNLLFDEVVDGLYRTLITFSCSPYKISRTNKFNLNNNKTWEVENNGWDKSPLRARIDYNEGQVGNLTVTVTQDEKELYNFGFDYPPSGTKTILLNSEDLTLIAINAEGIKTDVTSLASSPSFPYIPKGKSTLKFNAFSNGYAKSAVVEFDERTL